MSTLITVLHVIVCLFLMLTVLLQSGKGGGMGAAFGGGNAATVFGGSGASGFLKRMTAVAGSIFMMTSMILAFLSSRNSADALDSYGKEQKEISKEKVEAKARALKAAKAAGSGSGSGSGAGSSSMNPLTPLTPGLGSADIEAPILTPEAPVVPPPSGSAAPTGSAKPTGSAAPTPTVTPAGSAAPKPATPPVAPVAPKPVAPAPTPAPKPPAPTPTPTPAPAVTPAPTTGSAK